jgi:hypothetical protein
MVIEIEKLPTEVNDLFPRPATLDELVEIIDEMMDSIKILGSPFDGRDERNSPYEEIRQRLEKTRHVMQELCQQRTMDGYC